MLGSSRNRDSRIVINLPDNAQCAQVILLGTNRGKYHLLLHSRESIEAKFPLSLSDEPPADATAYNYHRRIFAQQKPTAKSSNFVKIYKVILQPL